MKRVFVYLIRFYQGTLALHTGGACRFTPSCSNYGIEAFERYDFFTALKLTAQRIWRCRPGGPCGHDPLV